jgi:hypothetical protein
VRLVRGGFRMSEIEDMDEDMMTATLIVLGEIEGGVFSFDTWEWQKS